MFVYVGCDACDACDVCDVGPLGSPENVAQDTDTNIVGRESDLSVWVVIKRSVCGDRSSLSAEEEEEEAENSRRRMCKRPPSAASLSAVVSASVTALLSARCDAASQST